MKLILVASMQLATYLVISADFRPHHQERLLGPQEGLVEVAELLGDLGPRDADDDAVGLGEVVDRRPFLEELGVAGDVERGLGDLGHPPGQLGVGADRHGALDDDRLGAGEGPAISRPTAQIPLEVGPAVVALRRPDGDEDAARPRPIPCGRSVVNRSRPSLALRWTSSARPGS